MNMETLAKSAELDDITFRFRDYAPINSIREIRDDMK